MIYLTGVASGHTDALKATLGLDLMMGLLVQPGTSSKYAKRAGLYSWIGIDSGLYSTLGRERFTLGGYLDIIDGLVDANPEEVLWATAPDVVGDWEATLAASLPVLPELARHVKPALVAQDGATPETTPWDDFYCLFLGGSTAWKESPSAYRMVKEARRRNKWTHMGRVNSLRRLKIAARWGCDSADGTYLKFTDPVVGLADLADWLHEVNGPDPWNVLGEDLEDYRLRLRGDDLAEYNWRRHHFTLGERVPL